MWLFTKYGMYSVVVSRENPEIVMIRARDRQHLLNLKKRFNLPKQPSILTTKDADYRYRLIASKEAWAIVAKSLANDIDYSNFKDACKEDHSYHHALTKVWGIMWELQER